MKKSLLILTCVMLLSMNGYSQWYTRQYGVKDINQLTQEQLNEALIKAQNRVTGGIVLSVVGAVGIGVGSYLIAHSKKVYPDANDVTSQQGTGFIFLVISIPIEIAGLTKWSINSSRVRGIRTALKSAGLKMGLIDLRNKNICSCSQVSVSPCLSVKICF